MASGPFLLPFHAEPIGSFWSEWWAAALGLAAAVAGLLAARKRALVLPPTLGIPASMLLALVLQFMVGRLEFPQIGLLYAAYVLWAGLLMVLGRYLADTLGLARLGTVLAVAFAVGALAGATIALAQWLGIGGGAPWLFPHAGGGAYANLGQANHHAHYSWLGIASMFYLRGRGCLSRRLLWLAVPPIVLGSVVSGSRSVLLYPLILLGAAAWARRSEPGGATAALLREAAALLPLAIALDFFASWVSSYLPGMASLPASRLYESVSSASTRLALARSAWSAFVEHPWLGQGAGGFPWASFTAAAGRSDDQAFQVAEHAHNFVLQGLAEFGAPVTGAVILLLLFWARRFAARPWGLEEFWCGAVLGIGAAHALLEYPLWYAYFLGPTALLLGATDSGDAISLAGRRLSVYLALTAVAGAVILTSLRVDYSVIEAASNQPLAAHPDREQAWRISLERLIRLHRESLLAPWALLAFAELAEPGRQQVRERVTLCERGTRFAPARSLLTRCAIQLAIAGRDADAQALALSVLRAFPAEQALTADELARAARKYPETASLRALSLGK